MGGAERHLLSLLPALSRRGLEVRMCVLGSEEIERFVSPLRRTGVEAAVVPAGADLNPALAVRIRREVRAFRPDVVHTHLIHGDTYGQLAARAAGVPAVSSVHSTHAFYRREPYRSAGRLAWRLARRTIAISEHVRRFLLQLGLVRRERVAVIPYGIDLRDWELPEADRSRARERLGLGDQQVAFGMAARLIPHKGHDVALEAMARVLDRGSSARLLVAGDGPLRASLEERALRLPAGSVRFLGYVADVRSFLNACDALVFPTEPELGEGFGMAALEAMAAARPVVATRVGSLPEVVVPGETGLLVRPADPKELADAMAELAGDPALRQAMGARGRERTAKVFTLDAMVDRTLAIYAEVVGR